MAKDINIGGRLHSIATGNVVAGADEILDDNLGKKQTQINTETYSLVESVNNALDALNPDQQEALGVATKANANEAKLGYYVCDTDTDVAAKTVAATNYVLGTGGSIKVKMTNDNTVNNATLNINSTGAKPLFYEGARASSTNTWAGGDVLEIYYDGTNYQAKNVSPTFKTGEKVNSVGVDDEPTAGSDNLVKSGGVSGQLLNNYFIGEGSTLVTTRIYGLIPGTTYTFKLKNNEWDKSETTSTSVNCLAVANVYNGDSVNLWNYNINSTPPKERTLTIPENSDYIEVKGRANRGIKVSFQIVDVDKIITDKIQSEIAYMSLTAGGGSDLQIEENKGTGNSIYIYNNYWVFYNSVLGKIKFASNIEFADALEISVVTSPLGVTNCIEIDNDKALVYDCKTDEFSIISISAVKNNHIQFISCHNGLVTQVSHGLSLSYVRSCIKENNPSYPISRDNEVANLTIESKYITEDGTLGSSGNWRCFVYNNIQESRYGYSTFLNNNGITKAVYIVLNTIVTSEADINANTIIDIGPLYKQFNAVSDSETASYRGYVDGMIDVGSSAKSIVILCLKSSTYDINTERVGLFKEANFINMKHFFEIDSKTTLLLSIGDKPILGELSKTIGIAIKDKAATPILVSCYAKYTAENDSFPTLQIKCGSYQSIFYKIGEKDNYTYQQWRIPPIIGSIRNATISINVPDGVVLNVSDFSIQNESVIAHDSTGLRLDSHLGMQSYAGQNTEKSFLTAALCGYKACITNPILTSDGVFVCYHNDNAVLNVIGNTEKVSLTAEQVHSMTYNELVSTYEVSNDYFKEKIPTVESFFKICAKTGMKPVFSVHPAVTEEQWLQMKTLLMKYGLLGSLRIKSNIFSSLATAYSVLGEDIEGYMVYLSPSPNISSVCSSFDNAVPAGDIMRIVEFERNGFAQSDVDYAIAQDFLCSVWNVYGLTGEEYKEYMAMGISGFTDDYNCCSGLNW